MSLINKYTGKAPCAGCKRSGVEVPRFRKDDLCNECQDLLKKGEAVDSLDRMEYVHLFQSWWAFRDEDLEYAMRKLLSEMNNKYAPSKGRVESFGRQEATCHTGSYRIPKSVYNFISTMAPKISNKIEELKEREAKIEAEAKAAIQAEYDKVYNAGIERGRNLLISLAAKDLKLNDLTEMAESYPVSQ